jgi:class 3 adenylate cyclase
MTANAWVAIVGGIVGIVGAIIGYTKFVAQAPLEAKATQLEGALKRREQELQEKDEELRQLKDEYSAALQDFMNLKSGRSAALIKREIDNEMTLAREAVRATASSVLVPGPLPYSPTFVFLSIYGPAASKLRKTKVPITQGVAGKVFDNGLPNNFVRSQHDDHFAGVDKKGGYETNTMVTVPLNYQGRVIGVLQFLNKEGDQRFNDADQRVATQVAATLAPKAAEFLREPSNFEMLGISTGSEQGRDATILFCDLTASYLLLQTMDSPSVIDAINEYLERQADIAFKHGGTVDKYLGDGAMFAFNTRRGLPDRGYEDKVVEAAIGMQRDFKVLKESWLTFGMAVGNVYNRIGIASGSVLLPVMGHPQFQQITVFGDTVGRASHLCEVAPRDRDVILIDDALGKRIEKRFGLRKLDVPISAKYGTNHGSIFELALTDGS